MRKAIGSRVIFMNEGRIAEEGPPSELFHTPRTDRLRDFIKNSSFQPQ